MSKEKQEQIDSINRCVKNGEPVWIMVDPSVVSQMTMGRVLKMVEHNMIKPSNDAEKETWAAVAKAEAASQAAQ